jgi:hypothetical protein
MKRASQGPLFGSPADGGAPGDGAPRDGGSRKTPWQGTPAVDGPVSVERRPPNVPAAVQQVQLFQSIKGRVHRRLIERLNLSSLDRLTREQVVDAIQRVVYDLLAQESAPLNF